MTTKRLIIALCVFVGFCTAGEMTYTIAGTGSGTVNGTPFTNAPFVFNLTEDTTLITPFSQGFKTPARLGVTIQIGLLSGTFTNPEHIFDNQTNSVAGISDSVLLDLLDGSNPACATYNLQFPFGPVPMSNILLSQFVNAPTSFGNVTLTSASGVQFSATELPEPANVLLTGAGMLGVIALKLRKSRTLPV